LHPSVHPPEASPIEIITLRMSNSTSLADTLNDIGAPHKSVINGSPEPQRQSTNLYESNVSDVSASNSAPPTESLITDLSSTASLLLVNSTFATPEPSKLENPSSDGVNVMAVTGNLTENSAFKFSTTTSETTIPTTKTAVRFAFGFYLFERTGRVADVKSSARPMNISDCDESHFILYAGQFTASQQFARGFNGTLTPNCYPVLLPAGLFTLMKGGTFFTKLDLADAYLQIEVTSESHEWLKIHAQNTSQDRPGYITANDEHQEKGESIIENKTTYIPRIWHAH
uniref:Reverse transcriptase domain-containing protein n=1 Tax=Schistocephalus solidus TaxID=70667 RepID=A0A183SX09_SCHSO